PEPIQPPPAGPAESVGRTDSLDWLRRHWPAAAGAAAVAGAALVYFILLPGSGESPRSGCLSMWCRHPLPIAYGRRSDRQPFTVPVFALTAADTGDRAGRMGW
ncbi:hypothetical protein P1P75_20800, partial [Streptomyces sp. ID05-39B]|uniref:hypothetical protein n=1 Tax=Streptomyces sp. ID05-39B TaxID=3028664 RepID=UPI0029AED562